MKLNKRGSGEQASLMWIVGAIIGILITGAIVFAGIAWYNSTTTTEDSFDSLVEKITLLEEGETNWTAYQLPEHHILLSFSSGENYAGENNCENEVDIPKGCGTDACLCVCDTKFFDDEDACTKRAVKCHAFSEDKTKELTFSDLTCDDNPVYREGTDSGIFTLYYKKEGDSITFCETKDCINQNEIDAVEAFDIFAKEYNACAADEQDCHCNLDFTFLDETKYAVQIGDRSIELWDIKKNKLITNRETDISIATGSNKKEAEDFGDYENLIFYRFQDLGFLRGVIETIGEGIEGNWVAVSPTIEDITQKPGEVGYAKTAEKQMAASNSLYKTKGSFFAVDFGYPFKDLEIPACQNLEQQRENEESNIGFLG